MPPWLVLLREVGSHGLDRLDHPQLRDARRLLRATQEDGLDVLFLGESVLNFVGPRDADRRRLPTMVRDGLGRGTSLLSISGGGYHAELLAAYLQLLTTRPHPPRVLVLPLWVRGRLRPWVEHPRFGHTSALRTLHSLDPARPPWRVRGSLRPPTGADFARFHEVPYSTLLGARTVGDYAVPLKAPRTLDVDERLRLLYAYHHGGQLEPGSADLAAVTRLGGLVRELGIPAVIYQTPLSVQTGEMVLGPAFGERVAENFRAIDEAFRLGAGPDTGILQSGTTFGPDEFIDPLDGSEHLNEHGRRALSASIVEEVRQALAPSGDQ